MKFCLSLLNAWLVLPLLASAATTPPAAPSDLEDNEPVVLSPFTVDTSKDQGYRATNSTSGTRLNRPIKDIPIPIEVITAEFIRDIGANDLREALAYSAGILTETQTDFAADVTEISDNPQGVTGGKEQTQIKLRGFVTTESLRRGFRRMNWSDSVNIDRVEVVRGPSALLYGVGNFGGLVNYITKTPLQKTRHEVRVGAGSWGFRRADVDSTGPISDKFKAAYRLTAAYEQTDDWTEIKGHTRKHISPVFEFKPFTNTNVLIDLEHTSFDRSGIGFQSVRASPGNINDPSSRRRNEFLPTPGKDHKTFRWSGPDTFMDETSRNYLGEVTQKIGSDLTLLVGGQYSTSAFDSQDVRTYLNVLAATTPAYINPADVRIITFYPIGLNPRVDRRVALGSTWSNSNTDIRTGQARVEANYHFSIGQSEHNVMLGHTELARSNFRVTNGTNFNRVDLYTYRAVDDMSYFRVSEAKAGSITMQENTRTRQADAGTYLAYQGDFFSNRVNLIGGLRYDRSDARVINYNFTTGAEQSIVGSVSGKPSTKTSPQVGVSVRLTPEISLFGLHSTGLTPNYDRVDGNGAPFAPTVAKSREFGVKVDLVKGKISGTVSSYNIERSGVPYYVYWAPNNTRNLYNPAIRESYQINFGRLYYTDDAADNAYIARIMAAQNDPNGTGPDYGILPTFGPGGGANNPTLDTGAYCPVNDESQGVDAQLVFTLADNWQIVTTYSHTVRTITEGPAFVKYKYYTGNNYPIWFVRTDNINNIYGGGPISNFSDPTDSSTYNRTFAKGLSGDDTPADTFALWSNYRFKTGLLNGLSIGTGVKYQSPRSFLGGAVSAIGTINKPTPGNKGRFEDTPEKTIVDLTLTYRAKFAARDWTFTVNALNLLDDQQRYGDIYQAPRTLRLTVGAAF